MTSRIHPSAIIHPDAQLGEDVDIGPYVIVGPHTTIGARSVLHPFSRIVCRTSLGVGCVVNSGAIVGGDPQDLKFHGEDTDLVIGDRCKIGEYVTINRGTEAGGSITSIGNDVMIMAYAHIAHDCRIGNNVIITNSVQLAGHIVIEDMAWISGMAAIHHFVTVGTMSFVAPMSGVVQDVPPYTIIEGFRDMAKVRCLNIEGLKRRQTPPESIRALKTAYRLLFRVGRSRSEAIAEVLRMDIYENPFVKKMVDHLINSQNGYQGRALESLRPDKTRRLSKSGETRIAELKQ